MFSPGEECLDWVFGWLVNGARRKGRGVGMAGSCAAGHVETRSGLVGRPRRAEGRVGIRVRSVANGVAKANGVA